jgi:glycosyltransferase involved in cell wall biosynthesis
MDKNKEIIFIVYSLCESNGTERAVVNLANSLVNLNIPITILSLVKQRANCSFKIDNKINQESLNIYDGVTLIVFIKSILLILNYLWNRSFSHVVGSLVYINFILVIINQFKGFKLIACEHIPYEYPMPYVRFIRRIFYKLSDTIVCLNESELVKFQRYFKNVIVAPNIIPSSNVATSLDNNRLLCVSRMSKEKGIDILLDMLNVFYKDILNHKFKVDIIGDGPLLLKLIDYCNSLGLSKYVTFLGKQEQMLKHYASSDMVLVTSRYEGFGLVIAEAMSCGVPVISFDVESGPRHIINNGFNGILIEKFNILAYSEGLGKVLNNPVMLSHMSINAKFSSKRYNEKTVSSIWMKILQ